MQHGISQRGKDHGISISSRGQTEGLHSHKPKWPFPQKDAHSKGIYIIFQILFKEGLLPLVCAGIICGGDGSRKVCAKGPSGPFGVGLAREAFSQTPKV